MWLDPTNYIDYEKLPNILKQIQNIFNDIPLEEFRKIGEPWPNVNAFSILLFPTSSPIRFQYVIKQLSTLTGIQQAFLNIIGPHTLLPEHRDNNTLGDIISPINCFEIVLAIKIPSVDPKIVGFKVGDETRSYDSGSIVAFNGQTLHEGWNNSNDYRITLCIDIDNDSTIWK